MSLSYDYDGPIVVIHMDGDYTTAQLREVVLRALDDSACPSKPVLLLDGHSSAVLSTRTPADVQEMGRFCASIAPRFGGRAAVVATTDLAYGLVRIGAVFAEQGGVGTQVFRSLNAARAWLLTEANTSASAPTSQRVPESRRPS